MGAPPDPKEFGTQIGADFLLEGRFFSDGSNTRLHAKLIAVKTGAPIWSHAYDLDLTPNNKMALQQKMADEISTLIAEPFGFAHRDVTWNSRHSDILDLNAYECFLQAHLYELHSTGPTYDRALNALRRAVHLLPDCGTAWGKLSELYCDGYRRGHGGLNATRTYLDQAQEAATQAYQLCSECSSSSIAMAGALFARGRIDEGLKMGETALAQNPNDFAIKAKVGRYLTSYGDKQVGLKFVQEAVSSRPITLAPYNLVIGGGHYIAGDHRSALDAIDKVENCLPFFKQAGVAANYAELGEKEEARQAVNELKKYWPGLEREKLERLLARSYPDGTVTRYLDSLRCAGFAA